MQCKQCGKFFEEHDIYQIFCSVECWNKACLTKFKYASPKYLKVYLDGAEVKKVNDFEVKQLND